MKEGIVSIPTDGGAADTFVTCPSEGGPFPPVFIFMLLERFVSVLFVTHSVPEAVFLSDKIVVMTGRPGQVQRIIDIDLSRPRNLHVRQTSKFGQYVEEILELFMAAGLLRDDNWQSKDK